MSNVLYLKEAIEKRLKDIELNIQRRVDAQASYTEMARCLKIIEMNSMPELRNLKAVMRHTLKQMVNIGNDKENSNR